MEQLGFRAVLALVRFSVLRLGCRSFCCAQETNAHTPRPIRTADCCILARYGLFVLTDRAPQLVFFDARSPGRLRGQLISLFTGSQPPFAEKLETPSAFASNLAS